MSFQQTVVGAAGPITLAVPWRVAQATRPNRDTVITQYHRLAAWTVLGWKYELSNVRNHLVKVSRFDIFYSCSITSSKLYQRDVNAFVSFGSEHLKK